MPQNRASPEATASPELPNFSDRLPDLVQVLRLSGRELSEARPSQSYIPYFEDVYAVAHSLKGVIGILDCPKPMADFIFALNETLLQALSGIFLCRKNKEAGTAFLRLADALDRDKPAETADLAALNEWLPQLAALYSEDGDHEARLKEVPAHLFYVNAFVSKKAREISLLKLNFCVVEDEILLEEIPLWRTQLQEALLSPEFGRGLVVSFLPFVSSEGSRRLKLWAWVAAASYSRAGLKQRLKEVMLHASLTKL
jgi:hypothetical protein